MLTEQANKSPQTFPESRHIDISNRQYLQLMEWAEYKQFTDNSGVGVGLSNEPFRMKDTNPIMHHKVKNQSHNQYSNDVFAKTPMIKDHTFMEDPKGANISGAHSSNEKEKYTPTAHMFDDSEMISKEYKDKRQYWMNMWKKFC